jgi:hypothetical protein
LDPKKRRAASSFIFSEMFRQIRDREDIQIASSTMNLTIQQAGSQADEDSDENRRKVA